MIARLGQVLFWAGCIVAALVVVAGLLLFSSTSGLDFWTYMAFTATTAGVIFLSGRAARYVLAGN